MDLYKSGSRCLKYLKASLAMQQTSKRTSKIGRRNVRSEARLEAPEAEDELGALGGRIFVCQCQDLKSKSVVFQLGMCESCESCVCFHDFL